MILAIVLLVLAAAGIVPTVVAVPLALGSLAVTAIGGYLLQRRMALTPPMNGGESMTGRRALTVTDVDRDGTVRFANELWRARSSEHAIPSGRHVRILQVEGLRLLVEETEL